uniref:GTD-binding domain-containing protein n=2 Tax=Brassica oleracea var. oleracea TaxID=109376 RepID=A0A0D3DH33_BRAOL
MEMHDSLQIHRLPQSKYVDGVRWLPQASALNRFFAAAYHDPDSESSSIEIQSLDPNPNNSPSVVSLSSWTSPSRVSSLEVVGGGSFKPMVSAATSSGSVHVLMVDLVEGGVIGEVYAAEGERFHVGRVEGVDWREGGECVTVGDDGRVNVVTVVNGGEGLRYRRVFDGNGLVGYRAVKWASPSEFVTGGYGFGLQLWDQRKAGEAVSQLKGSWFQGKTSAIVHSIDIHPSRKHTCIAGGSSGTVFAWDLRWPKQPIVLSGVGASEGINNPLSESEVWEVQYDSYTKSNISSSRILPVMTCSEDGILGVIEQGEEPVELLAEPCAINSFDIDRQNPQLRVGIHSSLLKALAKKIRSSMKESEEGALPLFKEIKLVITLIGSASSSIKLPFFYNLSDMVERSHSFKLPGAEINDLRMALYERKEVVERLQDELEAEREASATSASEAMSMILRLQGEKAELAMEAEQYKRIVEEEMSHAEMSFALLEDFIYQKEVEITALEYQVEAYRNQLLSLGYSDLNSLDDVKLQGSLSDRSQTPSPELVDDLSIPVEKEVIEQSLDSQKSSLDVYWEQIKKLDEQVKELTHFRDSMQYKSSMSESRVNKREEDVASSSKGLCKSEETLVIKVAKHAKMDKKSPKQTRDRSGKRNRGEYQAELQRLRQRVERLERERTKTEPETSGVVKEEEISLVREVKEEVSSVQSSEVKRSDRLENLQPWIDPSIVSIQEAMLYFWL